MSPELQAILVKAAEVGAQALGSLVATAPVWGPVLWQVGKPLVRAAVLRAGGAQTAAALDALELSLKPAISAAVEHVAVQVHEARKPGSPGGSAITPEEYQQAVAVAAQAAWAALDKRGLLRGVVEAYGGEEAVRASIRVLVRRGLARHHGIEGPA